MNLIIFKLSVIISLMMLFGCQTDDPPAPREGAAPAPQAETEPAETEPAATTDVSIPEPMQAFTDDGNVVEIAIEGDDAMTFDMDEFMVQAGQMVRVTLTHTGTMSVQSMGHNVVILEQGEDLTSFAADVIQHGGSLENDWVPEAVRDRVVAFTPMIGGGETATAEFRAPDEAGDYPFLCSFPGHATLMNGVMRVIG